MHFITQTRRSLFLFSRFLAQNTKIKLEYKADSIILFFSGAALQGIGFLFLSVLFTRIPSIQGWTKWEIIFMLSLIFFSEGLVSFAFEGAWQMAFLLNMGDMDRILLRPVSPILQILTFTMGIHGIGNMVMGTVLFILSLSNTIIVWSAAKILFVPVFIVSACAIRTAISFAANCSAFWIKAMSNAIPLMIFQLADFAKYPASMFGRAIETLMIFIIPYAFISYIPAVYLFDKFAWGPLAWLSPLVALWLACIARKIFYFGLSRYESTGN